MSTLYLQNNDYIVKIIGYDGSSITGMEVAEVSAPNTWYTFGSVALEGLGQWDGAYVGTHEHKFVGFGANEAAWAGNNFILFTPLGLEAGQSITSDALLLSNDWGSLYHQTGLIATDVHSELGYGLAHNYILDSDAADPAGGEDGTSTSVTHVSAEGRQYASFDGSSSFIEATDLSVLAGAQWSISMWLKTDSTSGRQDFFSQWYNSVTGNYPSIALSLDGGILKGYYRGDNKGSIGTMVGSNLANGEWRHVTYVKDASHIRLFVDGSQAAAAAFTEVIDSNAPVVFGAWDGQINGYAKDHYFNGSLDNIMIYSRGLSAAEVSLLHTATTVVAPPTVSLDQDPSGVGIGDVLTATVDLKGGTLGYFAFEYYNADTSSWTSVGGSTNAQYDLTVTEDLSEKLMQVSMEVDGQWYFSSQWTMPVLQALVGHWSFDNGDAVADVGTNGVATGVDFITDSGRTVASFDASSGEKIHFGDVNEVDFGTGDFSVGAWVNFNSISTSAFVSPVVYKGLTSLANWNGYALSAYQGQMRFMIGGGNAWIRAEAPITTGAWHHVIGTRSGAVVKLYIDGSLVDTQTDSSTRDVSTHLPLTFGSINNGTEYKGLLDAMVDDVRIYSKALDLGEVQQLHDSTLPPAPPIMVNGTFPLYTTEAGAINHPGGDGTVHTHVFDGVTYYMSNGLNMDPNNGEVTQWHGTYGLEGHWSFDNGDATADVGDDGSASNVTFETLDGRTAATFVGSGGMDIPHSGDQGFDGTTTTVSAWFKTTQTSQGYAVLKGYGSGNDMWLIAMNESGGPANKAMFFWRNRAETTIKLYSTTDINDGAWHQISTVRDGENLYLYVDGVLEDSATGATGTFDPTQAMRLGKWDHDSHSAGTFYVGSMDDFRIHSRAMDADEVAYWYAETTVTPSAPAQTTDVSIFMTDSYGDGWTGNVLNISDAGGNVVFTSTGPASGVTLPAGLTESLTVNDGETYTWALGGGTWPNEVGFIIADVNGVELVNVPNLQASTGAGSFVTDVFSAPATIEAAVDSFASDEMVVSVVLNTVAQSSATAWAWSLSDDFVVGAPSTGTVVALGQTATISVTPGTVTVYVAAIDGSGNCIATADVIQDTVLVSLEISKSDTYGDGWNNAVFTMTDSNGVVVVNEGLASGGKDSPVVVNVQLAAGTYDYQLTAGSYPGEISMSVTNLSSSEVLVSVPVGSAPASGQVVVAPPTPSVSVTVTSGYQAIYFFATPNQLALDAGADKWAVSATPFGDVGTTIGSGHVLMDLNAAGFVYSATEDTVVGYAAVVNSSTGEILAITQGSGAAMQNQLPVGQEMVFMAVLAPMYVDGEDILSGVAQHVPASLRDDANLAHWEAGPFYMGDLQVSSYGTILTDFTSDYVFIGDTGLLIPTNFNDGMGGTMSAAGIGRMVKDMIRKLDMHQLSGAHAAAGQIFQAVLDGSDLDACKLIEWEESSLMLKQEGGGYAESTRYKMHPAIGEYAVGESIFDETIPPEMLIIDGRTDGYWSDAVDPGAIQGLIAPAEMVISGQASVASGEVTMTVEVGENAVDQGAVSWVYALDQSVGDLGQVAVGTSVTIGSSAVFTPAPASYTVYVAAVDASGVVLATDSFSLDARPMKRVRWELMQTDLYLHANTYSSRLTITDSVTGEEYSSPQNVGLSGGWNNTIHNFPFEIPEGVYNWECFGGPGTSDFFHIRLVEIDENDNEIRPLIYVWNKAGALKLQNYVSHLNYISGWSNGSVVDPHKASPNVTSGQIVLPADTVDPIIDLEGDASMTVFSGYQFEDPGYTVSDAIDPSPNVTISGNESLNVSEAWIPTTPQDGSPVISGELLAFDNPNWFDYTVHKETRIPASADSWEVLVEFDNYAAYGNHSYHFLDLRLFGTSNIGYLSIRMTNAGGNGFNAYYKDGDNGRDQETALTGIVTSGAMKITREGDDFKFYYSLDKATFELVQTIPTSTADVLGNVFGNADLQISLRAADAAVNVTKFNRTDIPYGAQEGDYTITYSAEDFSGNTHSVQRTVSVVPETYQWDHSGRLTDIVQYLFGTDPSGERSHMYLKNDGGNTKLYFTKDQETWSAFSEYGHDVTSIEGAPTHAAYGPAGKVLLGTSTGCLYLIELDADSIPLSYTKVHDNGGTKINRVHYALTPETWVIEYGEQVYTMVTDGGTLISRMSIPSGSFVTDISAGDDAYCVIVRKADFKFATFVVLPGWATIHDKDQMKAIFSSMFGEKFAAANVDYNYLLDQWTMADEDGNVIMTDAMVNWLL